jgi:hypothetical protein
MPPVSPNSSALINFQNEKRNMLTESQINEENKNPYKEKVILKIYNSNSLQNLLFFKTLLIIETKFHNFISPKANSLVN